MLNNQPGWRSFTRFPYIGRSNALETVSELVYTPKNERDFGTLACWARNSIGKQTEPCLFQVVPAGELSTYFGARNGWAEHVDIKLNTTCRCCRKGTRQWQLKRLVSSSIHSETGTIAKLYIATLPADVLVGKWKQRFSATARLHVPDRHGHGVS